MATALLLSTRVTVATSVEPEASSMVRVCVVRFSSARCANVHGRVARLTRSGRRGVRCMILAVLPEMRLSRH